jgi:hypothetical protein
MPPRANSLITGNLNHHHRTRWWRETNSSTIVPEVLKSRRNIYTDGRIIQGVSFTASPEHSRFIAQKRRQQRAQFVRTAVPRGNGETDNVNRLRHACRFDHLLYLCNQLMYRRTSANNVLSPPAKQRTVPCGSTIRRISKRGKKKINPPPPFSTARSCKA